MVPLVMKPIAIFLVPVILRICVGVVIALIIIHGKVISMFGINPRLLVGMR
jgi:hypothetical protein